MDAPNVVLMISEELPDVPLTDLMRLVCINITKQVCALPARPIAPSVGSYPTARAAPALSSALSPLPPFARVQRACSYASTSDASLKTENLHQVSKQYRHNAYPLRR